jgi:hypothetical protein
MTMSVDTKAIRARAEVATEGPWGLRLSQADGDWRIISKRRAIAKAGYGREDAAFIAHARADIPALCDEVERLRAYVGDLKRHGASLHKAAAAGRDAERAAVVAFVRGARLDELADAIERGEHRREEEG